MRRWNGWGDESTRMALPDSAGEFLQQTLAQGNILAECSLADVMKKVPASKLNDHNLLPTITLDKEQRVRHAKGQSLPDWLAMHSGNINIFPDAVCFPNNNQEVQDILVFAEQENIDLIPYGGGTSVAGHINPQASERAIITVNMSHMNQLLQLDKASNIATFGAGTPGPMVEAQLRAQGYTLGHFPQSFELSTIGGWVASRSSGQQSLRYGRIEQMFAGGSLKTFEGTMELPTFPASSAGPDLREIVLGSEGRFGIISEVKVRVSKLAEQEQFTVLFFPAWQAASQFCQQVVQQRRGAKQEKCMLTLGLTGSKQQIRASKAQLKPLIKKYKGISTGNILGKRWAENRFKFPYLREALWLKGYVVDTLETATDWQNVENLMQLVESNLRETLKDEGENVHVFTHLSHVYSQGCSLYTTYLFRNGEDYQATLDRWQKLKHIASKTIVENGGTISHQHGVGKDHASYLVKEKGLLGMKVLNKLTDHFDPQQRLNPGTLLASNNDTSTKN